MVAMKKDEKKTEVADMESKFMQALQKEMGDVEITEESVREYIAKMTPEQRQRLSAEGQDLKTELLTNSEHDQELQVFRNELNSKAEAAGLPVEKDGEHLGKKLLAHMRTTNEAPSHLLVLEAIASSPFLVKLAIAEARDGSPKADADDLSAIEAELRKLKVDGWRSEAEEAGRAPFVRRNLLLLHFVLYIEKIRVELKPATTHALSEISAKVARIADMLFQYCLQNRWVKAALSVTEVQALLLNGLWDHKDDECREIMLQKMTRQGLKVPKLSLAVSAADVEPGQQATIKVEVTRCHAYSAEEVARSREAIAASMQLSASTPQPEEGQQPEAVEPKEGWWVIAEGIRASKRKDSEQGEEITHNSLVGRQALVSTLEDPVMSCEVTFQAPTTPGEYKVMIHVRSTGCVGVDVRRKLTFEVKQPRRTITPKAPTTPTTAEVTAANDDDVPQLQ